MKKKLVYNMFVSSAYYFLYESCMISGAAYYDDNCLITLNNIGATCEDRSWIFKRDPKFFILQLPKHM